MDSETHPERWDPEGECANSNCLCSYTSPQSRVLKLVFWSQPWKTNVFASDVFSGLCHIKRAGCETMSVEMSGPQYLYPIHESVRDRLSPEYVEFYERYLINLPQVTDQPIWISREASPIAAGGGKPLPVGRRLDLVLNRKCTPGPGIRVRAFFPEGEPPAAGWPAVLYFHGGGFVFGCLDTENTICSHMCVRARCVVVTVDYR